MYINGWYWISDLWFDFSLQVRKRTNQLHFKYGLQRYLHNILGELVITWSKIYGRKGESFYRKVDRMLKLNSLILHICFSNRLFWVICIALAWIASGFLIVSAWDAFQHNAIQFVVETSYRDWDTDFPAIAICESKNMDRVSKVSELLSAFIRCQMHLLIA